MGTIGDKVNRPIDPSSVIPQIAVAAQRPRSPSVALAALRDKAGPRSDQFLARGYVIAEGRVGVRGNWRREPFAGLDVHHDPRLSLNRAAVEQAEVLCLGLIFDTRRPGTSLQECLQGLAQALARSEAAFLDELAETGGRYVLLYRRSDGRAFLLTDATGIRCALYHRDARVIGSHLELVALNVADAAPRPAIPFRFGYPGRRTPREKIDFLTPNTKLDLATMQVERYWPVRPLRELSVEDALPEFVRRLQNSYAWLEANALTVASLTAGLDSRVTLAASHGRSDYFTYYRSDDVDTDALDRDFALRAAEAFKLRHVLLTRDRAREKDWAGVLALNTFRAHIPVLVCRYAELWGRPNTVHIRSNLSEIGRFFYRARNHTPTSPAELTQMWALDRAMHSPVHVEAFKDFVDATDFFDAPVEKSSLFYWEHRMGAWHSQIATETDPAFETTSLYNCRRILELMLSVSQKNQRQSTLLRRAVKSLWPELTTYPVNGKELSW